MQTKRQSVPRSGSTGGGGGGDGGGSSVLTDAVGHPVDGEGAAVAARVAGARRQRVAVRQVVEVVAVVTGDGALVAGR